MSAFEKRANQPQPLSPDHDLWAIIPIVEDDVGGLRMIGAARMVRGIKLADLYENKPKQDKDN